MAKDHTKKTDYVKVASYLFFEEYRKERSEEISGVIYNKFITLLYRDLKPEKDIKLPHCWYRWGDIVVSRGVPYVTWEHRSPEYTVVKWDGGTPEYDPNDRTVSLIRKNIAEFMVRHSGPEAHETAKDEVYENAPFEFQKEYRKLRESLELLSGSGIIENRTEYIGSLFDNAMKTFPKNEFGQISGERDKFETIFKMGLRNNASSKDLFEFAELFWFFFCYHLRIHRKCHENIPPEILNRWIEDIPWENMRMEHFLQNFAAKFRSGADDDPVVLALLEDWKERMAELDDFFSLICSKDPPNKSGVV